MAIAAAISLLLIAVKHRSRSPASSSSLCFSFSSIQANLISASSPPLCTQSAASSPALAWPILPTMKPRLVPSPPQRLLHHRLQIRQIVDLRFLEFVAFSDDVAEPFLRRCHRRRVAEELHHRPLDRAVVVSDPARNTSCGKLNLKFDELGV